MRSPSSGVSDTSGDIEKLLKDLIPPAPSAKTVLPFVPGHAVRQKSLDELLFDTLADFKIHTAKVAMHLERGQRDKLFSQFDSLLDAEEWDKDDTPPSLESFKSFLRLLLMIKPSRKPGLGATSDGRIIAAWTSGRDRLTIECLSDDTVRWVLSRTLNGQRERAAGETKLQRVNTVLGPYDPECWFSDAG